MSYFQRETEESELPVRVLEILRRLVRDVSLESNCHFVHPWWDVRSNEMSGKGNEKTRTSKISFYFTRLLASISFFFSALGFDQFQLKKSQKNVFLRKMFSNGQSFSLIAFDKTASNFYSKKNDKWYLSKTPICLSFSRNEVQYNVNRHIHL